MITLGKKYQTQSGLPVRILCIDGPGSFPVIGLVNEETISYWESDGTWLREHQNTFQLVPVPTKHEGWGFYSASETAMRGPVFFTKEDALRYNGELRAFRPRDAVIAHVTWED